MLYNKIIIIKINLLVYAYIIYLIVRCLIFNLLHNGTHTHNKLFLSSV